MWIYLPYMIEFPFINDELILLLNLQSAHMKVHGKITMILFSQESFNKSSLPCRCCSHLADGFLWLVSRETCSHHLAANSLNMNHALFNQVTQLIKECIRSQTCEKQKEVYCYNFVYFLHMILSLNGDIIFSSYYISYFTTYFENICMRIQLISPSYLEA